MCGILAVFTTLANLTVLIVFLTNKKLMNGQTIYRMSLAMSDILVGIFVFPTFIGTSINHQLSNFLSYSEEPTSYINAVGFFTMQTSHASVLTLTAAATDRFRVVYRPLTYNKQSSISVA